MSHRTVGLEQFSKADNMSHGTVGLEQFSKAEKVCPEKFEKFSKMNTNMLIILVNFNRFCQTD